MDTTTQARDNARLRALADQMWAILQAAYRQTGFLRRRWEVTGMSLREVAALTVALLLSLVLLPWLRLDVPQAWAVSRDFGTVLLVAVLVWAAVEVGRCLWRG